MQMNSIINTLRNINIKFVKLKYWIRVLSPTPMFYPLYPVISWFPISKQNPTTINIIMIMIFIPWKFHSLSLSNFFFSFSFLKKKKVFEDDDAHQYKVVTSFYIKTVGETGKRVSEHKTKNPYNEEAWVLFFLLRQERDEQ